MRKVLIVSIILGGFLYYLNLERRYRYLYEQIRTGKNNSLFCLSLKKLDKIERKNAKVRWYQLLSSPSYYLFYPVLLIISVIVVILKFNGSL